MMKRLTGIFLMITVACGLWYINGIGESQKTYEYVLQYQQPTDIHPHASRNELEEITRLMNANARYFLYITTHNGQVQNSETAQKASVQRMDALLEYFELFEGRVTGSAVGSTVPLPFRLHETYSAWNDRLHRVELKVIMQ